MRAWVLRQVVGFHSLSNVPHKHYTILQTDEKCKSEEISFRFNSRGARINKILLSFNENKIISTSCHGNGIAGLVWIYLYCCSVKNKICNEITQRENSERDTNTIKKDQILSPTIVAIDTIHEIVRARFLYPVSHTLISLSFVLRLHIVDE